MNSIVCVIILLVIVSISVYVVMDYNVYTNTKRFIGGGLNYIVDVVNLVPNTEGIITDITSGDMIVIHEYGGIKPISIKMSMINIINQDKALQYTESVCEIGSDSTIDIDWWNPRKDDNHIGVIYCNNINVNESLLDMNLASIDKEYCIRSEFLNDEWIMRYCTV